jgi:Tol biopolymer transport system component
METGETRYIEPDLGGACPARWSPDGQSFLFCGSQRGGGRGLFQVDVHTGEVVPLRFFENNGVSFWTNWGPDGETVYYRVDYGEESRIEALHLATGEVRTLRTVQPPDWIVMLYVEVSPDGGHLAFWEWSEEATHLYVIPTSEVEGEPTPTELLVVPRKADGGRGGVGFVRWSQDGRYVLYLDTDTEGTRLWRVPAAGGEPEPTELFFEKWEYPQFSPDGTRIAFDWGESSWEVWVMENYLPGR